MHQPLTTTKNVTLPLIILLLSVLFPQGPASAQGTAFTYQGRLNAAGAPASGSYDMSFTLFNASTAGTALAGPVTNAAVSVTNGLFTTAVDFGSVFTGASNWLQIAVSTNGANAFTNLVPRQQLTPTPYALYAESANASGLTGALSGNGSGLTNLSASQLSSGTVPDARLPINVALLDASQVFASPNIFNSSVGISVNNTLQFGAFIPGQEPNAGKIGYETFTSDSLDIVGAGTNGTTRKIKFWNEGGANFAGGANFNGAVGVGTGAPQALLHVLSGSVPAELVDSPLGAGTWFSMRNSSAGGTNWQFISTGSGNGEGPGKLLMTWGASPGGVSGYGLTLQPGGNVGVDTFSPGQALQVGGLVGSEGIIRLSTVAAVGNAARTWDIGVPNGGTNTSGEFYSFAIQDTGAADPSFMIRWDTEYVGIGTTNPTSLLHVRQSGNYNVAQMESDSTIGCWLGLNNTGGGQPWNIISTGSGNGEGAGKLLFNNATYGSVVQVSSNGNLAIAGELTTVAINVTSDRNAKEHFTPVNALEVLDKVARLPITEWQYKQDRDDGVARVARHIGPVAQDFSEAFALGHDDKHISVADEGGVALSAIQGLNEKLEEKDAEVRDQATELTRLKSENQALAGRLAAIERALGLTDSATASK